MRRLVSAAAAAVIAVATTSTLHAEPARPVYSPDGVVKAPAFELPPSSLMSAEAAALLKLRAQAPASSGSPRSGGDIAQMRQGVEKVLAPNLAAMRERYPVEIVEQTVAGVPVRIITPKGRPADAKRVLINLHGGGFIMCADACALLESLPIASLGGFKVISVNYRQSPEAKFPAASEDIAAVYKSLLKTYKPRQIGIYGCSAGGSLSAAAAAWLPAHGLPQAGAIGVFGAGAVPFFTGDSAYTAAYTEGSFPTPPVTFPYFAGADMSDPMISPGLHPELLAKFPPTLLITGTRAFDMSPAVYTHSLLVKAGVPGDLIVGEGLGHCYMYTPGLPESQDAYRAIVKFFKSNLG